MNAFVPNLHPRRAATSSGLVSSQSLTVSDSAVSMTTAPNESTKIVTFDVQDANVRVRWDGTNPDSSTGHMLYAGQTYAWHRDLAANSSFIRDGSTNAVIFFSELVV